MVRAFLFVRVTQGCFLQSSIVKKTVLSALSSTTREARYSSPHGDMIGCLLSLYSILQRWKESKDVCYLAGDVEIFYHQFGMSAISATKAACSFVPSCLTYLNGKWLVLQLTQLHKKSALFFVKSP